MHTHLLINCSNVILWEKPCVHMGREGNCWPVTLCVPHARQGWSKTMLVGCIGSRQINALTSFRMRVVSTMPVYFSCMRTLSVLNCSLLLTSLGLMHLLWEASTTMWQLADGYIRTYAHTDLQLRRIYARLYIVNQWLYTLQCCMGLSSVGLLTWWSAGFLSASLTLGPSRRTVVWCRLTCELCARACAYVCECMCVYVCMWVWVSHINIPRSRHWWSVSVW